jgi:hypothetical protein
LPIAQVLHAIVKPGFILLCPHYFSAGVAPEHLPFFVTPDLFIDVYAFTIGFIWHMFLYSYNQPEGKTGENTVCD